MAGKDALRTASECGLRVFSWSAILAAVAAVGMPAIAFAQATMPGQTVQAPPSTATPQRMPARPLRPGETPPKGTAVIKGQVLASTGSPVRRAQVRAMSMEARGGSQVINSRVPLSEMFGYATDLRSRTQGRGSYSMHFDRYEPAPASVSEEVVARVQGR